MSQFARRRPEQSWPGLLESERGRALKLIRIPLGTVGQESENIRILDVPIDADSVVAVDMVQTQDAVLHAIFITSGGDIFYIQQGAEPQPVVGVNVDLHDLPKLIVSVQGDVYVFFPVKGEGIGYRMLHKAYRL